MKRVLLVAVREFVVTVSNRAFIVGLLVMPVLIAMFAVVGPRLFNFRDFKVEGDVRIIDPTGLVVPQLRTALDARRIAARRAEVTQRALQNAPPVVRELAGNRGSQAIQTALGPVPELRLEELPRNADIQKEKTWLLENDDEHKHIALIAIHPNAVLPAAGGLEYGTYDLFVPANLDDRSDTEIQQSLREALISARGEAQSLNRERINAIIQVPRVRSVTVTAGDERQTVRGFNIALPVSVAALLFIGVMTGGQALLTSTVEEKSNRVIEVLLSAVSPMELMAGKLIGQMAVSLLVLALYIAMGLSVLTSLSMFGLFNPWLILYVVIFFIIMYLVFGSLMMAVGAAVNEMREAQGLDDAAHVDFDDPMDPLDADLAQSEFSVEHRTEFPSTSEHLRHAAPYGFECASTVVAGLAVDRDWRGIRHLRDLVRCQSLSDRPADVWKTAQFRDVDPLGAIRIERSLNNTRRAE